MQLSQYEQKIFNQFLRSTEEQETVIPFWKCIEVKCGISSQQASDLVKLQMCSLDIQDLDAPRVERDEIKGFNLNSLRITTEMLGEESN